MDKNMLAVQLYQLSGARHLSSKCEALMTLPAMKAKTEKKEKAENKVG